MEKSPTPMPPPLDRAETTVRTLPSRTEHTDPDGPFEPGADAGDREPIADDVVLAWLPHAHVCHYGHDHTLP